MVVFIARQSSLGGTHACRQAAEWTRLVAERGSVRACFTGFLATNVGTCAELGASTYFASSANPAFRELTPDDRDMSWAAYWARVRLAVPVRALVRARRDCGGVVGTGPTRDALPIFFFRR